MNFIKLMPLWRLSSALTRDSGGQGVKITEVKFPSADAPSVTRSVREWENGFVESTESMFKELKWELALEGK
jgi:hypothetical protein